VRPIQEIHTEIEGLSERRTDLWHQLGELHDPAVRAELKEIDEQLNALWDEERADWTRADSGLCAAFAAR
jgi:hypothetical protein